MRLLSGRSPAHGFCDDEQTRRLLRSRPPRQALAWAAARLGGQVVSARALRGGMSSAVHLITVQRPGGRHDQAVLRRYVRPDPDEPDPAGREARALRLAEAADVPTPALLAVDPDGTGAGVPALLMTRLPGRPAPGITRGATSSRSSASSTTCVTTGARSGSWWRTCSPVP